MRHFSCATSTFASKIFLSFQVVYQNLPLSEFTYLQIEDIYGLCSITPLLSAHNLLKVDQLITSVRAKFIHNLRTGRLPDEFNDFVKMINVDDENVRSLRFANFNFNLNNDKSSAKYSISKSWNSLPYNLKSEQPDEFLEELKQYFNISNDEECQVEKCWLCGHD